MKKTADHPFLSQSDRPKLDMNEEFNTDQLQFYKILVCLMLWFFKIGRIDILTDTSLILTYLLAPRVRHVHRTLHLFKYLKDHKRSKCVFVQNCVDITYNHILDK